MPPATSEFEEKARLAASGWTDSEYGLICPCDHKRSKLTLRARIVILTVLWTVGLALSIALSLAGYGNVWTAAATALVLIAVTALLLRVGL